MFLSQFFLQSSKRLIICVSICVFCFPIYLSCSESSVRQSSRDTPAVKDNINGNGATKANRVEDERARALIAMGYFDRAKTDNPKTQSVTQSGAKAFDGYYLFGSRHRAEAYLMDGDGTVVHKWKADEKRPPWMYSILLKNGDILTIAKGRYLARYNWNSELIWKKKMGAHHDVTVGPDDNIYVLEHRINQYKYKGVQIPIMDDNIVVLSQDGKKLRRRKLFPLVRELVPEKRFRRIRKLVQDGADTAKLIREGAPSDTTHTNSIQVIPKDIPGVAPAGSILLSVREINRIVILDNRMDNLLWSWGEGELEGQHHATLIDNGNITIFDNGVRREQSRVTEMNPTSGDIVWTYASDDFYSRLRGSVQKLPNGNYLVTESDTGHVFEITKTKEQVWEFWNPDVIRSKPPTRGVIYRMMAYPADYLEDGLLKHTSRLTRHASGQTVLRNRKRLHVARRRLSPEICKA